jgi:hypothetical protein
MNLFYTTTLEVHMKKKKFKIGITLTLLLAVLAGNAFAYNLGPTRPTTKTLTYYTHGLSTEQWLAATNAADTWSSVSKGISFYRAGDSTGTVSYSDLRSDVSFANFSDLWMDNISPTSTGICITNLYSNYSNFDIYLNSNLAPLNTALNTDYIWGDSNSSSIIDRQGIFTHEFGHAAGLAHNNSIPGGGSPQNTSPVYYQTMWPTALDPLGNNISYYLRTLEIDDISGVRVVASQVN